MNKIRTLFLFIFLSFYALAQPNIGGRPLSEQLEEQGLITPLGLLNVHTLNELDMEKVYSDQKKGLIANQFAVGVPVNMGLQNSGLWEQLPNGDRLWRLALRSKNAIAMISLYKDFFIPAGAKLYVYNENRSVVLGGFTSANNPKDLSWGFSTAILEGEVTVYEYYEPKSVAGQGRIFLDFISHVFSPDMNQDPEIERQRRDREFSGNGFGDAATTCSIYINCSTDLGKDWQKEKRAVARISLIQRGGGAGWCTGSLINNTALDEKPLFYSANHCVGDVDYGRVQYYFNYESPSCSSQLPANSEMIVGSTLRMTNRDADTWLVELSGLPSNPYFLGWSREDSSPGVGIGISHPSGDVKMIHRHSSASSNSTPLFVNNGNGGTNQFPANSHWTTTVTKGYLMPGSSGSALLSENDKLIYGTLHSGGPFDCTPNNIRANYGKVSWAWSNGSNSASRLKEWLDPIGRNVTQLPPLEPGENNPNIIISEVAHGRIANREVRFIELFNANKDRKINLSALNLVRYIDGNPNNAKTIVLRSNFELQPLKTFVIANAAFDGSWGLPPHDFISTELGDGNDTYELFNLAANSSDTYGEKGKNGTGRFWEYTNKVVSRRPHIFFPNNSGFSAVNFSEWESKAFSLENITPGKHSINPPKNDLMIAQVIVPSDNAISCDNKVAPIVVVRNNGEDSIPSYRLKARIGGKQVTMLSKVGIGRNKSQTVDFSIENGIFDAVAGSTFTLELKAEMDLADDVASNDTAAVDYTLGSRAGRAIVIEIKTDDFPEQTVWELFLNNTLLYSQDYTGFAKRTVYKSRICLDTSSCYTFRIRDKASNGIASTGYYKLYQESDNIDLIDPLNFSSFRNFSICPIERPQAPTECKAIPKLGNIVEFSWKDNAFNEDGYQIQRQFPSLSFGIWEDLNTVNANRTFFEDILAGSQVRTRVTYRVRAYREGAGGVKVFSRFCELSEEVLSIEETAALVEVFPNPSSGLISLRFASSVVGTLNAQIFDLTGRRVLNQNLNPEPNTTLDLQSLPKGVYTLKITTDQKATVLKIVLE
jgi:hypothetical protein